MKAVGYFEPLAIDQENALTDIDLPTPQLRPFDVLARVRAVSVNPVDAPLPLTGAMGRRLPLHPQHHTIHHEPKEMP